MSEIVNRVKNSSLLAIDLADYIPAKSTFIGFDFKDQLWNELILKEKDFRVFLKDADWTEYTGKHVYLYCSSEAILPSWSYMLLSSHLIPFAASITIGTFDDARQAVLIKQIENLNEADFIGAKIIVKGCSDLPNTDIAMIKFLEKVQPVCSSVMFGEPCSTVPIFKKK